MQRTRICAIGSAGGIDIKPVMVSTALHLLDWTTVTKTTTAQPPRRSCSFALAHATIPIRIRPRQNPTSWRSNPTQFYGPFRLAHSQVCDVRSQ
jgi:hypothetical protein